ncbi:MAG: hypothetical protein LBF58_00565 [Deltaproteobacteria bacterium]|nr:hypothetical protein [Deltaproteobacteria bacterium]
MSERKKYDPTFIGVLILVATIAVGLVLIFLVVPQLKPKNGISKYAPKDTILSPSAVGFAGLYDMLGANGDQGVRRLGRTSDHGQVGELTLVVNGISAIIYDKANERHSGGKLTALVFANKWGYSSHPDVAGWVAEESLADKSLPEWAISLMMERTMVPVVERVPWPGPEGFSLAFDGPAPAGQGEIQLWCANDGLGVEPIVWAPGGILVGRFETAKMVVYAVSDPDVANNMGLGQGENAAFTLGLIGYVVGRERLSDRVAFFEALTGNPQGDFSGSPVFGPLLEYPLIIVTILIVCSAIIFAAALGKRFGGAVPVPQGVAFGKSKLIENSSRLMARPNLLPAVLEAYRRMTVQWAGKALHAPALPDDDLTRWLDRAARAKGVSPGLSSLKAMGAKARAGNSGQAMLDRAAKLYKFRKELESGSTRPGHSRQ